MPVHVAIPSWELKNWQIGTIHKVETVWVTEGALKADIAVEHCLIAPDEANPTFSCSWSK